MFSLDEKGKAAIVVPTGFITEKTGIAKAIRKRIIEKKWLRGAVSMPPNIFAKTGTHVSVIFLDKEKKDEDVILIDASNLGTKTKEGKKQKTVLSTEEEQKIINTFKKKEKIENFSVIVTNENIEKKNYSFSAGQYFDVKIEYIDITPKEFEDKMKEHKENLKQYFKQAHELEKEIEKQLEKLKYEK